MSMHPMAQVTSTRLDNPSKKLVLVKLKEYSFNRVKCCWSQQPSPGRINRFIFMHQPIDCVASKGDV